MDEDSSMVIKFDQEEANLLASRQSQEIWTRTAQR